MPSNCIVARKSLSTTRLFFFTPPGTGLGLAIAKHLVDLTGGNIFFESDPTIKPGTTCVVEMPLKMCNDKESKDNNRPDPSSDEEATMIDDYISLLIVDDIRMNRTMFKRRFNKRVAPKAAITEAATGEEALEICKQKQFDVIIVDQHMEEAGGVLLGTDTVVAMRRRKIDSVIIGCSGNDIDEQFMDAGCEWVMKKPTPPDHVIVKKLRQLLKARSKKRALQEPAFEGSPTSAIAIHSPTQCPPAISMLFRSNFTRTMDEKNGRKSPNPPREEIRESRLEGAGKKRTRCDH